MTDAVKLLTEAEWMERLAAWSVGEGYHLVIAELRERGLIAPEPVDPLLHEARTLVVNDGTRRTENQNGAILEGRAGQDKVELALAALKRGMEMRAPLTREMVREAVIGALTVGDMIELCDFDLARSEPGREYAEDFVDRLHAAVTKEQS